MDQGPNDVEMAMDEDDDQPLTVAPGMNRLNQNGQADTEDNTAMSVAVDPTVNYVTPNYPHLPPSEYAEWSYKMRRSMQEIVPGLFLGPYASVTRNKLDDMVEAGITHVVCVRQLLERTLIRANHPEHFQYLVVEFADTLVDNIIPHFKVSNQFIENALNNRGKVLVHGNGGVSRSAALVIAFIMARYGVTCKKAFMFVQQRRFCVNPNENFMAQLREYEPIYQALHTVPLELPTMASNAFRPTKRPLEYQDDADDTTNDHESKAQALDPIPEHDQVMQ